MTKTQLQTSAARTVWLSILWASSALAQSRIAFDTAAIRRDVAHLASDRLEGRRTGTPGNDSAAAYIARRYRALGLRPPADRSFLQPFVARPVTHPGAPAVALPTQNVFAVLPGTDPELRNQYIVIGAHFDHLGRSSDGALDPDAKDAIRNGADDNASGTAAVLELARVLAQRPLRRSVIFANFSGEEQGLLGSQFYVEHPIATAPLDRTTLMVNFDMVGRLRNGKVIVYGVNTATELPAIVAAANAPLALNVTAQGDGFGPSDHSSFYAKDIPVLHFFTDLHDDYHRATDDVEKLEAAGEARVLELAERVVREVDARDAKLTFVKIAAPPPMTGSGGSDVYLGSIPDMTAGDVPGLRLTGVRAGSPADSGGLKAGDVIVEFGGKTVKDLYEYSAALYSHKPGDEVSIVVLRDGKRVALKVKLGRRGG